MRILLFAVLSVLAGCGKTPTHNYRLHTTRISGRVVFTGPVPERGKLDLSANPTCERQHLRPVLTEDVVVNKNGTLRNTLVWLKSGVRKEPWVVPANPFPLNQDGCVYQPHVLALMTGQTLEVSNADPLNHNVHAEAAVNQAFNVAQPPRAEKLLERFEHQELMIPITCGVHGWMRAYVSVIDHPYFAVTGDDGAFELDSIPAGTYDVEAVHEKYGKQEAPGLVVADGERKQVQFSYTAASR